MNRNNENVRNGAHCSSFCCTQIVNLGVTRGQYEILRGISLHIHCGELTAIIGPNGAGKSTLLRAIVGEIPFSGELKYLDEKDSRATKPVIGYVPQKLNFDSSSPISVYDLFASMLSNLPVWLFHSKKLRGRIEESLSRVNAEYLINRKLGALSGGELQRVLLALALDPVPDLLLLDEPVSGIDHSGLQMFYSIVSDLRKKFDLSIILVSHDLSMVAKYADRVIFINNKTVESSGTPEKVFSDKNVRELFGLDLMSRGKEAL
jgi:zinc transport system ATP-binding protein